LDAAFYAGVLPIFSPHSTRQACAGRLCPSASLSDHFQFEVPAKGSSWHESPHLSAVVSLPQPYGSVDLLQWSGPRGSLHTEPDRANADALRLLVLLKRLQGGYSRKDALYIACLKECKNSSEFQRDSCGDGYGVSKRYRRLIWWKRFSSGGKSSSENECVGCR
jgi:hypothetical protein